jgi:hypothetical protein
LFSSMDSISSPNFLNFLSQSCWFIQFPSFIVYITKPLIHFLPATFSINNKTHQSIITR